MRRSNGCTAGGHLPGTLGGLALLFTDGEKIVRALRELQESRRPWRGEALFDAGASGSVPMLVRADPVFSSPGRVLGFVLLFTDLSERRSAEAARRRFQDSIIAPHRFGTARLSAARDPLYHQLLSTVVENAQVAALEITENVDMSDMPVMLDSIRGSVDRTAEVLERLVWHAGRTGDADR